MKPTRDHASNAGIHLAFARLCLGKAEHQPEGDSDHEDDRPGTAQENPGALPQTDRQVLEAGELVARHLHDEAARRALGDRVTQYQSHHHRTDDPGKVERKEHQTLKANAGADRGRRNDRGNDHGVNRQAGRTCHERRDENGRQPVFRIGDTARRHDAGDGAGEAGEQRNEAFARQAHARHQAVHQKGRTGHVACRFHDQDEEEQDHDLWQKDDDGTDAGQYAFGQEVPNEAGWHSVDNGARDYPDSAFQRIGERRGPGKDRLEYDEQ